MSEAKWYVVHTYSGYEKKVQLSIENTIKNRHLEDQILKVSVPVIKETEVGKNGVPKEVDRKLFPGYVLIQMIMNDDTWYVVRNTRGVTGFVGPGSKPVPLSEEEISMLAQAETAGSGMEVGDRVKIVEEEFAGHEGTILGIDRETGTAAVRLDTFLSGNTETEVSLSSIKKL